MYLFQKFAATGFSYLKLTSRSGALGEICIIKQIFMRFLLKTEEATQLAIVIFALYYQPIHFAWWFWRTTYLFKFASWKKRIRIMFEWTLQLFFPRDITKLT